MIASPTAKGIEIATGMSAPSTHASCWRTAKRAKTRPWAAGGTRRWVSASKDGWQIAPAIGGHAREADLGGQRPE